MVEYKTDLETNIAEVIGFARDGSPNVRGIQPTIINYDTEEKTYDLPENKQIAINTKSGITYHQVSTDELTEITDADLVHPDVLAAQILTATTPPSDSEQTVPENPDVPPTEAPVQAAPHLERPVAPQVTVVGTPKIPEERVLSEPELAPVSDKTVETETETEITP